MIYNYTISTDTKNGVADPGALASELAASSIITALNGVSIEGDILHIDFKAILVAQDQATMATIVADHTGEAAEDEDFDKIKTFAVSDNKTEDGKILYAKIHGFKSNIAAGESHIFAFQNPYPEIYFFGAEIMQDIIGVADFDVFAPVPGHPDGGVIAEPYGYNVNLGTIKYIRETKFAARLPQGLLLRCHYTNDTAVEQEVGINYLMHELRDPA